MASTIEVKPMIITPSDKPDVFSLPVIVQGKPDKSLEPQYVQLTLDSALEKVTRKRTGRSIGRLIAAIRKSNTLYLEAGGQTKFNTFYKNAEKLVTNIIGESIEGSNESKQQRTNRFVHDLKRGIDLQSNIDTYAPFLRRSRIAQMEVAK